MIIFIYTLIALLTYPIRMVSLEKQLTGVIICILTTENDRFFQSFFRQIFVLQSGLDYQKIIVFPKKHLRFSVKTCRQFSKCIFTKQHFRKKFPHVPHVPPYTLFAWEDLLFFRLLRLYLPCITRTIRPFFFHRVRADSTVLFSIPRI